MKEPIWVVNHLQELPKVADELLPFMEEQPRVAFSAPMGAGKTTLVKSIVKAMGTWDVVQSPTFNLMNVYGNSPKQVYHFDFYRLKNEAEATAMGVPEIFYESDYTFVEWPEKIAALLTDDFLILKIKVTGQSRSISLHNLQPGWQ